MLAIGILGIITLCFAGRLIVEGSGRWISNPVLAGTRGVWNRNKRERLEYLISVARGSRASGPGGLRPYCG